MRGPSYQVGSRTLVDVLRATVADRPSEVAYRYLADAETESRCLSYADLERRSVGIAREIRRRTGAGERVLLLFAPGLEFLEAFQGCILAGVIAVPVAPPRPERPLQAQNLIAGIARTCQPSLILTGGEFASLIRRFVADLPDLTSIPWCNIDEICAAATTDLPHVPLPTDVALLQFTSGSTGHPKGVMVTHANLVHNVRLMQASMGDWAETEYAAGVSWLPPYHDMGLIGGMLYGLWIGFPTILMPPLGILKHPVRWLQAISKYRANTSPGPNFIFDTCSQRIRPEECENLDLSCWKCAPVGAEVIRAESLRRFARVFEPYGFRPETFFPCYGLAESTLMVSGAGAGRPPVMRAYQGDLGEGTEVYRADASEFGARELVSCGHAWLDQTIEVVDPATGLICPGKVGEIWVSGPSVAAGYWQQPEATEATFRNTLAGDSQRTFLRTGDLGFLDDGELFVVGRLKDLIIIRGKNFHPQDIETAVQSAHPALKLDCGAAFGVDVAGEEHLVIVQEIDRQTRPIDDHQLKWEIRRIISRRFEIRPHDIVFTRNGTLPRTTSGKMQRRECRRRYLNQELVPWTRKSSEPHDV